MENLLITVIVPVYNVENYLEKCINSIIKQTYRNLEIILVDDGSQDSSGNICDVYAQRDKRIVVLHKKNGGLSEARNEALNIAKGMYVTCVDSDDYLENDYIEYLYMLLKNNNADISICGFKKIYKDEQLDDCQENIRVFSAEEALEALLYQREIVPSAWGKLYKREIFDGIRYPRGLYYEDLAVIYKLLVGCKRIVKGEKQKYYYLQRRDSIMNEDFNVKKMHRIKVANTMKDFIDEKYPQLSKATSTRCFLAGIQVFREIPQNGRYKEYNNEAWRQIVTYRASVVRNSKAKASMRVMALSTYLGKGVLGLLGHAYSFVFVKK